MVAKWLARLACSLLFLTSPRMLHVRTFQGLRDRDKGTLDPSPQVHVAQLGPPLALRPYLTSLLAICNYIGTRWGIVDCLRARLGCSNQTSHLGRSSGPNLHCMSR